MWHSLDVLLTGLHHLTGWKIIALEGKASSQNFRKETQSCKEILLPESQGPHCSPVQDCTS